MIHLGNNKSKGNVAIVLVHFNWAGFNKPVENLFWFLRENRDFPIFGIELSKDKFSTQGLDNWTHIHCSDSNVCFQKEALINLLVSKLPKEYTKVAWIDHDIYFENRNWLKEAEESLEQNDVIQLFETANWADARGKIYDSKECFVKHKEKLIFWEGHIGFAWAANRDILFNKCGGLYPVCPLGGGDGVFALAIVNRDRHHGPEARLLMGLELEPHYEIYQTWKNKINKNIKSVSYISGSVTHRYHGSHSNRKYLERSEIMKGFKPSRDIMINGGILKFTPQFKHKHKVLQYFLDRKEDE